MSARAPSRRLSSHLVPPAHIRMFYCLSLLTIVALGRSSSVTTNTTAVRDKRVFSLFSIVQFPNQDCTTTDTNTPTGVCVTSEECTSGSGSAAGQCAAGFGGL